MYIKLHKRDLEGAIMSVLPAISTKGPNPLYRGVLIEADKETGKIEFRGTDLELTLQTTIDAEVKESGSIVVPAKLLSDIVKKLPDDMVDAKTEDLKFRMKCAKSKFDIVGFAPIDYPPLSKRDEMTQITLDVEPFTEMIQSTLYAATRDMFNGILHGVCIEMTDQMMSMTATNGFMLAHSEAMLKGTECKVIIPSSLLSRVFRTIKMLNVKTCTMSFDEKQLVIEAGNIIASIRLMTGNYLDYRRILASNTGSLVATVKRSEFADTISRVALLADSATNRMMKVELSPKEKTITLSSHADEGQIVEALSATFIGDDDLTIGFNAKLLLDMIKHRDEDELVMRFGKSTEPCIMEGENYTDLLLPIRII